MFLLSSPAIAMAQNQSVADSLISYIEKEINISDSLRFEFYMKISFNSSSPSVGVFYAKEAIKIAEKENNYSKLGAFHRYAGEFYLAQNKLVLALQSFLESKKYYELEGNKIGKADVTASIASVYKNQKNFRKCLEYQKEAIEVYQRIQDTLRLAIGLQNHGNTYLQMYLPDSALKIFHVSLALFRAIDYDIGIAHALNNLGEVYHQKGDYSTAENRILEALQIFRNNGIDHSMAYGLITLGEIYSKTNRIPEALPLVHQSLEIGKKENLLELISDASMVLSDLYSQSKDYEKAFHYHTEYVAYRDSINNEETARQLADLRTEFEVSQKQAEIDLLTKQRHLNRIILASLLFILLLFVILAFVFYRNNLIRKSTNKILSVQKEELKQQHLKLEALNHTKDRFFSIISHDLRGPVNAFNGISNSIRLYIEKNELRQLREVSEHIDKSAGQLSSLLDNLLDWSLKQQGAFPFYPEKLQLNPLLEESIQMFLMAAYGKKIHLNLKAEEEIEVYADKNSLMTILRNLINNAIKFTEESGLVTISAFCQNGFAMINVMDTGIGISEEEVENLFLLKEKFVNRGTAGEKGLGIGLDLAYEFAKMNNGSIIVNSEEDAGSIFTLKIPLFKESLQPGNTRATGKAAASKF